jgi:mannose-6-phosphate isomerase-like protein (cupin superfamily)
MPSHRTVRIDDLVRDDGWAPIRRELGVSAFGINAWTARESGAVLIAEHDEEPTGHEELYVVISGRARFTIDGAETDAPAGEIVFVPDPRSTRSATALEPATTVVSVGAKPGEPYRPRAWELNRDVLPLFDAGRHAEAKALLLGALDRYDDSAPILFNLACAEAQLGELDTALEHLRAAVRQRPAFAEAAREDDDLQPLRDHPGFGAIAR